MPIYLITATRPLLRKTLRTDRPSQLQLRNVNLPPLHVKNKVYFPLKAPSVMTCFHKGVVDREALL